jgi:hypothetical protein
MGSPIETLLPPFTGGIAPGSPLLPIDRCDQGGCSAQAFVRVVIADSPLLFCGHHFACNEVGIVSTKGVRVDDFRDMINRQSNSSAAG